MDTGSNGRSGKVVSAGHSTRVEGLNRFVRELEAWPEITSIRLGGISTKKTVGRKSKRLKSDPSSNSGLRPAHSHKRAKAGGGFSFKATRPSVVGMRITGIQCYATYGTTVQLVVLTSDNLNALKARLHAEGYGANW